MDNKNTILQELQQISPLLASVNISHPYLVEENFFENLPTEILDRIKTEEEAAGILTLLQKDKINPFITPPFYFDQLSDKIINSIKAIEASSPVEELNALSPLLLQLDKTPPFDKPVDYFQELSTDILAGVHAIDFVNHELETLPFILGAVDKENVYKVPDNYFRNLPNQLLNKVKQNRKVAVVFKISKKRALRYAVAAVVTCVIALGALEFYSKINPAANANEFAEINQTNNIKKISDDEIADYLQYNSSGFADTNGSSLSEIKEEEVKELFAGLSDEELLKYLEENSAKGFTN